MGKYKKWQKDCAGCGTLLRVPREPINGAYYCYECKYDKFVQCGRCNAWLECKDTPAWQLGNSPLHRVVVASPANRHEPFIRRWCDECVSKYAKKCDACGDYYVNLLSFSRNWTTCFECAAKEILKSTEK